MAKMLLIGASGSIGEVVAPAVLKNTDKDLVLASRHPRKIPITDASRETAIKLDVTNDDELAE
ncbi:NAD(P)H-binding protein, partial [Streptomyces scabiei]